MSISNHESKVTLYALSIFFYSAPYPDMTRQVNHIPKGKWPDNSKNQVFCGQIHTHKVTLRELINCRKLGESGMDYRHQTKSEGCLIKGYLVKPVLVRKPQRVP